MCTRMLICIKSSQVRWWAWGQDLKERESCTPAGLMKAKCKHLMKKCSVCRDWMMSNLNSNIGLKQGLPAEFSCFCHLTVRQQTELLNRCSCNLDSHSLGRVLASLIKFEGMFEVEGTGTTWRTSTSINGERAVKDRYNTIPSEKLLTSYEKTNSNFFMPRLSKQFFKLRQNVLFALCCFH